MPDFGLVVETSSGILQIDSSRGGDSGVQVVYKGTGNNPIGDYKSYLSGLGRTYTGNEILMVNTTVANGSYKFIRLQRSSAQLERRIRNQGTSHVTNLQNVNYVILERTKNLTTTGTNNLKSGDFGLQIFNNDDDELFDSRYSGGDGGIQMKGYFPIFGVTGSTAEPGYIYIANGYTLNRITQDLSDYVMLSNMGSINANAFDGIVAFNNFNITTGTNTNLFTGSLGAANQIFDGYYPIRWRPTPGQTGGSQFIKNNSDILYGGLL